LPKFVLFVAMAACGGERAEPTPHASPPATPIAKAQTQAPAPKPPIDLRLGEGYEMRHPVHDGRLTLIPIVATAATGSTPHYITLHDGMTRHVVTVKELSDWQVDTVSIRNKSNQPLIALSGELVLDAMQDRVIARDTIIAPRSTAQVPVRCVEQHRSYGGRTFHAGNALAELDLRELVVHKDQQAVWAQVDAINRRLGLSPPSGTYRLAAQQQNVGRANALASQLAQQPDRERMVGLAVGIDGRIVAVERFASPELYQQLEHELLGAYVSSDFGPPHEGHTLVPADVRVLATTPGAVAMTDASFVALQAIDAPAMPKSGDPWAM
jgi:hypothetical protein